jgi:hypothetical protein
MISFIAPIIASLSLLGATGYVCKDQLNNMIQQVLHGVTNQQQPTIEDFILLRQFTPIELMLHKGAPATLQHYRQLALMEKLESDPQKKAAIVVTLNLVERYLQEQEILSQEDFSKAKRPALTAAAAASSSNSQEQIISTSDINVTFLKAVQDNNVSLMEQLHRQGANPNCRINCLQPIEIAVAQGHIEATQWLLAKPITVTTDHTESSQRFMFIIESNFQEKFNKDQKAINEAELQKARLRFAIRARQISLETYEVDNRTIEENLRNAVSDNRLDLTFTTNEKDTDTNEQKLEKQRVAFQAELNKRALITTMLQEQISKNNHK